MSLVLEIELIKFLLNLGTVRAAGKSVEFQHWIVGEGKRGQLTRFANPKRGCTSATTARLNVRLEPITAPTGTRPPSICRSYYCCQHCPQRCPSARANLRGRFRRPRGGDVKVADQRRAPVAESGVMNERHWVPVRWGFYSSICKSSLTRSYAVV
jgi:hypothetical protein